jgi:Ca2+/Na+ antiporter
MAFTGCLAGPIFNLMLGMGLTTMKCNMILQGGIKYGNYDKIWTSQFKLTLVTICSSIFTLLVLVWLVVTNNYKLTRWHGHVLLWTYIAVVLSMVYCSL